MTDRKKVIKGLECCAGQCNYHGCPYKDPCENANGVKQIMLDAIALLKEQPEIVRCKDCKYCEYPNAEKEWCKKGHLHGNAKSWFCADGERKEGM